MEIEEKYKKALQVLNSNELINNEDLEKLLQSCCNALVNQGSLQMSIQGETSFNLNQLNISLLYILAQFARHSQTPEDLLNFLVSDCSIETDRAKLLENSYRTWYERIRIQLLNIGTHLPHITDVKWKIDHVYKSNSLDQSDGPLFRVSLKTEKYDVVLQGPKVEFVEFTCTSPELQDLVYKLKDVVRHCQKLASGHLSN